MRSRGQRRYNALAESAVSLAYAKISTGHIAQGIDFLRVNILSAVSVIGPGDEHFTASISHHSRRLLITAARVVIYAKVESVSSGVKIEYLSIDIAEAAAIVVPANKKSAGIEGDDVRPKMMR